MFGRGTPHDWDVSHLTGSHLAIIAHRKELLVHSNQQSGSCEMIKRRRGRRTSRGKLTPGDTEPNEEVLEVTKSPEGRSDIEVTFVYCWHTLRFLDDIYQKIKDADLILIEMTGGTRRKREQKTAEWNHILTLAQESPNDPDVQQTIRNF